MQKFNSRINAYGRIAGRIAIPRTAKGKAISWVGIPAATAAATGLISSKVGERGLLRRIEGKKAEMKGRSADFQLEQFQKKINEIQVGIKEFPARTFGRLIQDKAKEIKKELEPEIRKMGLTADEEVKLEMGSDRIRVNIGYPQELLYTPKNDARVIKYNKLVDATVDRHSEELKDIQANLDRIIYQNNIEKLSELAAVEKQLLELRNQLPEMLKAERQELQAFIAQQPNPSIEVSRHAAIGGGVSTALIGAAAAIVAAKRLLQRRRFFRRHELEKNLLRISSERSRTQPATTESFSPTIQLRQTPIPKSVPTPVPKSAEMEKSLRPRRQNFLTDPNWLLRIALDAKIRPEHAGHFANFFSQGIIDKMRAIAAAESYSRELENIGQYCAGASVEEELQTTYALNIAAGNSAEAEKALAKIRALVESQHGRRKVGTFALNTQLPENRKLMEFLNYEYPKLSSQLREPGSYINNEFSHQLEGLRRSLPGKSRTIFDQNRDEVARGIVHMLLNLGTFYSSGHASYNAIVAIVPVREHLRSVIKDALYYYKNIGVIRVYDATGRRVGETIQLNWQENRFARFFVPHKERNNNQRGNNH